MATAACLCSFPWKALAWRAKSSTSLFALSCTVVFPLSIYSAMMGHQKSSESLTADRCTFPEKRAGRVRLRMPLHHMRVMCNDCQYQKGRGTPRHVKDQAQELYWASLPSITTTPIHLPPCTSVALQKTHQPSSSFLLQPRSNHNTTPGLSVCMHLSVSAYLLCETSFMLLLTSFFIVYCMSAEYPLGSVFCISVGSRLAVLLQCHCSISLMLERWPSTT